MDTPKRKEEMKDSVRDLAIIIAILTVYGAFAVYLIENTKDDIAFQCTYQNSFVHDDILYECRRIKDLSIDHGPN